MVGGQSVLKKGIIEEDFSVIDIVSAYPFAMESDHPIGVNYKILNGAKANKYVKG